MFNHYVNQRNGISSTNQKIWEYHRRLVMCEHQNSNGSPCFSWNTTSLSHFPESNSNGKRLKTFNNNNSCNRILHSQQLFWRSSTSSNRLRLVCRKIGSVSISFIFRWLGDSDIRISIFASHEYRTEIRWKSEMSPNIIRNTHSHSTINVCLYDYLSA